MNNLTFSEQLICSAFSGLDTAIYQHGYYKEPEKIADLVMMVADAVINKLHASFKRTGEMFRQGDVLIAKIDAIPIAALPTPYEYNHAVLAHGEVTGHKHQLVQDEAQLFAMNDNMFLRIVTPVGYVRHEEHSPIALKQGDYQVIKQREASDNDDKPKAVLD